MSDDKVNIEINGAPYTATKGSMIIDVTDQAGIRVPRFCYHKKLSIAANCRMCMVEVEKAPKPLPACATPVGEGMKIFTKSPVAIGAQKGTMEFLLINHPLDCPICDQGGECELQDVAMGYGEGVSRYTENKRVVRDKNIGPLISTDMTRCIHCTRCVRFGQEIGGIRELGATGRGENMEIGTFIEKAVSSEMSGNVIDLCPVGALNAKPSRMAARAWELIQHASVAPHDSIGSNIYLHTLRGRVVRAVPRDNDEINETWISDRDRFSYTGLSSDDRLTSPMIKRDGQWQSVGWEAALEVVAAGLKQAQGDDVGALVSPTTTLEEMYLLQKVLRGVGVSNIDHRLRQIDFSDQQHAPLFPWLGQSIGELEAADAVLLIGANVRKEQPIAAHRLRKASLSGSKVMAVNPLDFDFHFDLAEHVVSDPVAMVNVVAAIAKAVAGRASATVPPGLTSIVSTVPDHASADAIAGHLLDAERGTVLLGAVAHQHPAFATLRALAAFISTHAKVTLGYLPEAANSVGAWLTGVVPHRKAGGKAAESEGLDAVAMLSAPRKAYVLFGVEPEYDCQDPATAMRAMDAAEFVVSCTSFASDTTKRYADVLLPVATFAETSGTFVNAEGRWQSFNGAVAGPGETRPGWKVLRVLGNMLSLDGFDYMSSEDVRDELKGLFGANTSFSNELHINGTTFESPAPGSGLTRISAAPIYATDSILRRATPLQETVDALQAGVHISSEQASALGIADAQRVVLRQGGGATELPLVINEGVPMNTVWTPVGVEGATTLAAGFGPVELVKA